MDYATQRSGFKIQSPLRDEQIWGIGMVVYQWGCLENEIDLWISIIRGKPLVRSSGQRASFKERANVFRGAINSQAKEPWRTMLLSCVDRAKEIQHERDSIVHQMWTVRPGGQVAITEWRNEGRWKDRAIEFKNLQKLILKIDSIRADLTQVPFKVFHDAGVSPEGKTIGGAWRHISGKQDLRD